MNPSLPVRKYKFTSIKYHYDSRTKPELVNTNGKEIHMWYRRPMLWDRWPCNLNPLTFQGFLTLRMAQRHFIFLKTNPMELYILHYKAHWLTSEKLMRVCKNVILFFQLSLSPSFPPATHDLKNSFMTKSDSIHNPCFNRETGAKRNFFFPQFKLSPCYVICQSHLNSQP